MKQQHASHPSVPVSGEPLALELVNTTFIDGGRRGHPIDVLTTTEQLDAWMTEHSGQFSDGVRSVFEEKTCTTKVLQQFLELRAALRSCLRAITDRVPASSADVNVINSFGKSGSFRLQLTSTDPVAVLRQWDVEDPWEIALGEIAFSGCELLLPDRIKDLRACSAPGCILFFEKSHPRREWCSSACGNRARVARHADKATGQAGSAEQ